MSKSVDPALFRLRTFEAGWIEPLQSQFSERFRTSLPSTEVQNWIAHDYYGTGRLVFVLLAEAQRWIELGRSVGYFPAEAEPLLEDLSIPESLEYLIEGTTPASATADMTAEQFATALSVAREDLTSEKRDLLRLVYFSTSAEWDIQVEKLWRLQDRLIGGASGVPASLIEEARWSFPLQESNEDELDIFDHSDSGGASDDYTLHSLYPARWRLDLLAQFVGVPLEIQRRRTEAVQATEAIADAAIRSLDDGEQTFSPKLIVRTAYSSPIPQHAFDLRSVTGIPTEPVGSLPRPQKLQDAYAAYDRGEIDKAALESEQDMAVRDSIERQEQAGSPIVSDGEQRWSSFATYPITDTLAGTGLADNLSGEGGQFFAIFADGHGRQLPRLTAGHFRYTTYAAETLSKSVGYTDRPIKQAVISPSMLYLLYPLNDEVPGYPKEQFERDLIDECELDIRKAFEAGAARVSIDFTEGRLATRNDPRNPWTGADLLDHFVEINNSVFDRFTAQERVNIGMHVCPGGDRDSVHSLDVPYNNLLPKLFKMNAGYFLIQVKSERDKDPVYESIGKNLRNANGVDQMALLGVTNPQNPRVESPDEIRDELIRAANFIPREQLGSTDDCGFSPFSIDEKPSHGSPDFARDVAFQKIENRVQGTVMAAEKLGVS